MTSVEQGELDLSHKWHTLTNWLKENIPSKYKQLNGPADKNLLKRIEKLIGEPLPQNIKDLYLTNNGERGYGSAIFFGDVFIPLSRVAEMIESALDEVKPARRFVADQKKSDAIIKKIVAFHTHGLPAGWHRVEFAYSLSSSEGPYLYMKESSSPQTRRNIRSKGDDSENIMELVSELYDLEKEHYNWDEIKIIAYSDGTVQIERNDFFTEEDFSSSPENAIKKQNTNPKWIPIFSDFNDNYLGVDLDPDKNGIKGQIILWGREEDHRRTVVARNLEGLFDICLHEIQSGEVARSVIKDDNDHHYSLRRESHLHDDLRAIASSQQSTVGGPQ